jgi:2-dehydro-3-deoxyphosphogluconate aldolase/(4S)-4-hydroxy-2-oxoglutarate aldolase
MSASASDSLAPGDAIAARLIALRVIPVLRLAQREAAARAIDCLMEAGYRTVELTLTTPDALGLIRELGRKSGDDFLVGAGTVLDTHNAIACLDAGADYLVSPCLVPGLAALARNWGRAALMGGFTPGEVLGARDAGSHIVKLFPASSGGPGHLAAVHAVFPEIVLCPTGGVSSANMLAYFEAGASLVGIGNNVIDRAALDAGDRAQVVRHARSFLDLAASAARPA